MTTSITSYEKLEEFGRVPLSEHFFMRDFLHSEIAAWHGLRNIPDHPDAAIYAGEQLCQQLLEPLQATFGRIHVRSGYRSPAVNEFGNQNKLNCASNASNYSAHIWDYPDAQGKRGATACIVVPWLVDHIERGGSWTNMAWWIHDHLPYHSLYFFPRLAAFNIRWHEAPVRRVDSYAAPKGCLIQPGTPGAPGMHQEHYVGFPDVDAPMIGSAPAVFPTQTIVQPVQHTMQTPVPTKPTAARQGSIFYRAVHATTAWRKVNSHHSLTSALTGPRGARVLLAGKGAIDYDLHGDALYVLVWEAGSQEGQAVRRHPTRAGEYQLAKVPVATLERFEAAGHASQTDLASLFA
ncbi:hypothetical protein [Ralstonia mannitolilytica]|uniref:hypothetical protein n=1 Tax=Ralstonia mannitolilytica TaxID=105219 RepID=UPI000A4BDA46|nr:hypothetical protein [Ralstonia mannitolilytica]